MKLIKIALPIVLILGLVVAVGCAATEPAAMPVPSPAESPPSLFSRDTESGADLTPYSKGESEGGMDTERRVVMTGYLRLEVKDSIQTMEEIAALAKDFGGYVVSSNQNQAVKGIAGSISIRIPVERFEEALDSMRKLAVDVISERTEGKDVTEEYSDLQAQLRNLEATEAQYLALLQKAQTVEDILKVQVELSNVRGRIEQIKGRIQYLERTSDMALIEVSLQETQAIGEDGWNALKTLKTAVDGLVTFGKVLANVLIWILIFCPVWGIILFLVIFFRRRRKAKAKAS